MAAGGTLAAILAAVRAGRVTPTSARQWAARAARGENIAAIATLAAAPSRERLGPHAMSALANDLAAILATGGTSYAQPGEPMGDEEAALLWPPRTDAEADSRRALVSAAATHAASMPEAGLYAALFGDSVPYPQGQTGKSADAPAQPGHQAFTGTHTHGHSAYQQGDTGPAQHMHPHTHAGDANHDHHGG
jgi:hypothetical protein